MKLTTNVQKCPKSGKKCHVVLFEWPQNCKYFDRRKFCYIFCKPCYANFTAQLKIYESNTWSNSLEKKSRYNENSKLENVNIIV